MKVEWTIHCANAEEPCERRAASFCWICLLSLTVGAGQLVGNVPSAHAQAGWGNIIVSDDPLMVNSVPSSRQLSYQTQQYGAFLHYGPAVFLDGDWASTPDPSVFNPTQLDVNQWVSTAKSFDAKYIVFSAKHHNGFALWQTQTTDYGVRSSPWQNGQGDLVRELADACRANGLGFGLYYSGQDRTFPCVTDTASEANRAAYWPVYKQQLNELLSNYGDLSCLWLDSYLDPFHWDIVNPATGKPYGDEIVAMARAKQPNAVIWGGTQPDLTSCSHLEDGIATPDPLWNVLKPGQMDPGYGPPSTQGWVVPEAYNCHGTFAQVHSTSEELMNQYYASVGRGANFLQSLVPDKRGLIDDATVATMAQFGAEIRSRFGNPLAQTSSSQGWLQPGVLEMDLGGKRRLTDIVLEEAIAQGQHVLQYAVDVSYGGIWRTVAEGQSIGRERIERIAPTLAEKVRLRILQANAVPSISTMFAVDSGATIYPTTIYDHFDAASLNPDKWITQGTGSATVTGGSVTLAAGTSYCQLTSRTTLNPGTVISFAIGATAPTGLTLFGAYDESGVWPGDYAYFGNWLPGSDISDGSWRFGVRDRAGHMFMSEALAAPLPGGLYEIVWNSDSVEFRLNGLSLVAETSVLPGHNMYFVMNSSGQATFDFVGSGPIPEPSALALSASGLILLLAYAWKNRRDTV